MAELGVGAGAEAVRRLLADVDGDVGDAELQRLKIGVDRHELDPRNPRLDHAVDGVDATATDTHNPNHGLVRLAASRRLVLRLLAPVARAFDDRLELPPSMQRLLGEVPLRAAREESSACSSERGLFGSWS